MTNTQNTPTGIDIRKAILRAGKRPSDYDEAKMLQTALANSISDWEIDSQLIPDLESFRNTWF